MRLYFKYVRDWIYVHTYVYLHVYGSYTVIPNETRSYFHVSRPLRMFRDGVALVLRQDLRD